MKVSKTEYRVAELIAWGASDKEIAEELFISYYTARTHRHNIMSKVGAANSADLTRWFFQTKTRVCFGINLRTVKHLATAMLALVMYADLVNVPIIRTRASVKAKTETVCRTMPKRKEAEYAA